MRPAGIVHNDVQLACGLNEALQLMQKELDVTMALTGTRNVKDASPAILRGV